MACLSSNSAGNVSDVITSHRRRDMTYEGLHRRGIHRGDDSGLVRHSLPESRLTCQLRATVKYQGAYPPSSRSRSHCTSRPKSSISSIRDPPSCHPLVSDTP